MRPEELDKFFRPMLACVVLFALSSIEGLDEKPTLDALCDDMQLLSAAVLGS